MKVKILIIRNQYPCENAELIASELPFQVDITCLNFDQALDNLDHLVSETPNRNSLVVLDTSQIENGENPDQALMIKQKFKNFDLIEVSEDSGFERHNLVKLISGWFYHDETIPKTIMNPYDGKEMILVPDGSFALRKGISPSDPGYNGGPRTVFNLPAFYIDRFPVTNREYMRFCKVTGHLKPPAWDTSRYPHRLEQHPVCGVNWMDALAYAGWSHKEIPLASQWEKAAYGEKGTDFPWGSSFDASYCNCAASETRGTTTVNHHSPEGDSMYGIADIVGNVWEWVYDWKSSPHNRMLMGGAWDTPVEFLVRPYYARIYANPGLSGANFGFRLCVSPDTALNWLPKRGEN